MNTFHIKGSMTHAMLQGQPVYHNIFLVLNLLEPKSVKSEKSIHSVFHFPTYLVVYLSTLSNNILQSLNSSCPYRIRNKLRTITTLQEFHSKFAPVGSIDKSCFQCRLLNVALLCFVMHTACQYDLKWKRDHKVKIM